MVTEVVDKQARAASQIRLSSAATTSQAVRDRRFSVAPRAIIPVVLQSMWKTINQVRI